MVGFEFGCCIGFSPSLMVWSRVGAMVEKWAEWMVAGKVVLKADKWFGVLS